MPSSASPPFNYWLWIEAMAETLAANADSRRYGQRLRAQRLSQLIQRTLEGSPFYRRRTGWRSAAAARLADFEPVGKCELMQHFDDWATDRRITREGVDAFLRDPARLADPYLGEYMVWTSSGTSGEPGTFVQDARSLATYDALDALRLRGGGGVPTALASWSVGQRVAYVGATGGHFAGNASITRLMRIVPALARPFAPTIRLFSVLDPLRQLVAELQAYQPTLLVTYPSCAVALAQEQAAGRLQLRLAETWCGGEQLSPAQREQIRAGFGCAMRNNYGASEFFSIAWECPHGHLHLNDDWVILEPVDAQGRAVREGEQSHSVLLTNLANRVQPLLRYNLGDRVRFTGQHCACGSSFPVIEVEGRADDTLTLADANGEPVTLLPLALATVIEEGADVAHFQLLRTAPDALELRFEAMVQDPEIAFVRSRAALMVFLARHGLGNVRIKHGKSPPLRQARSGKLCRVRELTTARSARPHADHDQVTAAENM
ncbi:MAG TPA: phenylacetate--CoA ligase family protein [Albitalea sp.]|nr:phenylacetate--CoA ligase family protein [Albitalea sp.]HJW12875.1 phenylacetate--CoA ligase family protein [Albitalea sp.]